MIFSKTKLSILIGNGSELHIGNIQLSIVKVNNLRGFSKISLRLKSNFSLRARRHYKSLLNFILSRITIKVLLEIFFFVMLKELILLIEYQLSANLNITSLLICIFIFAKFPVYERYGPGAVNKITLI